MGSFMLNGRKQKIFMLNGQPYGFIVNDLQYLVYGEQDTDQDNWRRGTNLPMDYITPKCNEYNHFLEYNSTNNNFVVKQAFTGIINGWVYNAYSSQQRPYIQIRINNEIIRTTSASSAQGAKGGDYVIYNFEVGNTISLYNSEDQGWGFGRIKIYRLLDNSIIDLNE